MQQSLSVADALLLMLFLLCSVQHIVLLMHSYDCL